jgi:dipeptidyl-peptidase 4
MAVAVVGLAAGAAGAQMAGANADSGKKHWTVKDMYTVGIMSVFAPNEPVWTPDSTKLTYLSPENEDLLAVDPATAQISKLVDHAKLAAIMDTQISEKDRDHRNRYKTSAYIFAPDSQRILFDTGGDLWLWDLRTAGGVKVASSGEGSGDDPKFSPDGMSVSYVKNHNLYVHAIAAGSGETNLSQTTDTAIINGEVDWVYEEELDTRSNYFWAPDSKSLAYLQANEAKVPLYPIVDYVPTHVTTDEQRYPQPGDPNPDVRVGVVSANGGATTWMKLPLSPGNDYIPRFGWVNANTLWVETLTRDHKHLTVWFADAATGNVRAAMEETTAKFFDESYDVTFLKTMPDFLLTSWRDGYTHIYRYSFDRANPMANGATLKGELEHGDYEVSGIEGVNEATKTVFYQSNEGDPLVRDIWAVQMDGTGKRKVSKAHGYNNGTFSDAATNFADENSDMDRLPVMQMCNDRGECKAYWTAPPLDAYETRMPTVMKLRADDGTLLYASLLMPKNATGAGTVPLINNPYGGPHAQTVSDRFNPEVFFDNVMADRGFAVLHVDNRGMGARGRDFEWWSYRNFGPVQFSDQQAGIDQVLAKNPALDAKRLGWWGWSWGGTFTLYAMTHSDRFKAGVDVAPVTDFRNYDSIYTERYLGLPAENKAVYDAADVNLTAKNLKGKLLMVHGTGDDNVHLMNTIQFVNELVTAGVPYDLQLYPRKTHSIAGTEARVHLFDRIVEHFENNLMNGK